MVLISLKVGGSSSPSIAITSFGGGVCLCSFLEISRHLAGASFALIAVVKLWRMV